VILSLIAGKALEATLDPANWTRAIVPKLRPDDPIWCQFLPAVQIELMPPVGGFVGSDLIASCLEHGWIDPTGNILHKPELDLPFDWQLKKIEFDQLQRAKAGIAATIDLLMARASVHPDELPHIVLVGKAGEFMSAESACRLGIVPDIEPNRIESHPHLALRGAGIWASSQEAQSTAAELANQAILFSPPLEDDFEDRFIEHLYLRPISSPVKEEKVP
jgi:uncharacterized 2Fe-2S/4Fe-4S cluster protein (DUF4445 family)